jgi:hypothetical protein
MGTGGLAAWRNGEGRDEHAGLRQIIRGSIERGRVMASIAIERKTYAAAQKHLAKRPEQVGFFLAEWNEAQQLFSVRTWHPLAARDLEFRSDFHVSLKDHVRPQIIKWAWDHDGCLIEAHSHGQHGSATFSASDLHGFEEWVPHVRWRLKQRPYAAIVTAGDHFDALAWIHSPGAHEQIETLEVAGGEPYFATRTTLAWRDHVTRSDSGDE